MRRAFCLIFLLSILFAFTSCDEEVLQNVVVVKEEVSKEVPAEEGGTVSSSDDSVKMTIPADALDSDTKITMTVYESSNYDAESDEEIITKVVECEPSGTVFKKPVFITLTSGTDIKNRIITAAVYNTAKEAWSYSPTGAAVKIAGYDAAGDPIMTTAAGDPIMLNAAGDPIMMSAAGDPIMLSAAGDPIMVTAAGDPIMNSAAGDPIMMTTGHFTTYTFLALGKRTEPEDSGDEGDDDEEDDTDGEPYVPECGNGITDEGEECDHGEENSDEPGVSNSTCRKDCTFAKCGDNIKDSNEACDDGNTADGDYCSADCQTVTGSCGDGEVQGNEACDDGNTADGDYCSADCQTVTGSCGDGEVQSNEECDKADDNGKTACVYGETSCTVCTTECKKAEGEVSFCGDGVIDEDHETCDKSADNGKLDCAYGETECTVCTAACRTEAGKTSLCGDGTTDSANGEACDNGADNGRTACVYGLQNCTVCTTNCQIKVGAVSFCGDGEIDEAHETCDNAGDNGRTACAYGETSCPVCTAECQSASGTVSFCGDGIKDESNGEACDNGSDNGRANCAYGETGCTLCTANCQISEGAASYCGDGIKDESNGEQCDNGSENGRTACAYGEAKCTVCTANCQTAKGTTSFCGDGIVDEAGGEVCDDGNAADGDYCSADCREITGFCGDGIVQGNEACDNAEPDVTPEFGSDAPGEGTGGYCSEDCLEVTGSCGDGIIQREDCEGYENCTELAGISEACDNGADNGRMFCNYGEEGCTLCTTECQIFEGASSYCGDGIVDKSNGEVCDNGAENGRTACAYGETSCTLCSAQCTRIQGTVSYCGDGRVDAENGETCDDGSNLNGIYGHCNTTCSGEASRCGDGNVDSANGETCDDGELNGTYNHCNTTCNGRAAYCGDGRIDEDHETCDNGADNGRTNCAYGEMNCTICTTECQENQGVVSRCGDGIVDSANGEQCDNGESNGATNCAYGETGCTLCSETCQNVKGAVSYCGDGRIDAENNETCDDGANLNGTYGHCNSTCNGEAAHCGDGITDSANGETCDDGELNGTYSHCNTTCNGDASYCGDGVVDSANGEVCDHGFGNGATDCLYGETSCSLCSTECQPVTGETSFCGDETIDGANGEQCDGGELNGQTNCEYGETSCTLCSAACQNVKGSVSYCGDGRIDAENGETCDDGSNLNGTYGHCNATCNGRAAHCGDGNVDSANGETCDDGELNGTYSHCNATCNGRAAHCGDGNIDEGNEICDNGSDNGETKCAYGATECQVCTTDCQPVAGATSYCGDGETDEAHEACDSGELNGQTNCAYNETECQRCASNCQLVAGTTSYCGDGRVDEDHEACDNGASNGETKCAYGAGECLVCTTECQSVAGETSFCGDGERDETHEACDNGELNGATNCVYGETSCTLCSETCQNVKGAVSYCGDGRVDAENGETCDDGSNLNGTYGHCNATCNGEAAHCGDGTIDSANGETCDDGELNGTYSHCNATCNGRAAHCGDGNIDEGNETCDNGSDNGETKCAYGDHECTLCTTDCQPVAGATSYCGDGETDEAHEACDNGELNGITECAYNETECQRCSETCQLVAGTTSYCGDGRVDEDHEACDNGSANGETKCAYGATECQVCTTQCQPVTGETSFCGDGERDETHEACDNGELNGATNCEYGETSCTLCSETCQNVPGAVSYCGDGRIDAENGETCDDGANLNGTYGHCNATCNGEAAHCGDGTIDSANGETCDDGELNGTYSHCNATCNGRAAHCGDGNIDEGNEICDNGSDNGRTNCAYGETECTLCTTDCQPVAGAVSYCGDGETDEAHEACDNGELNGITECAYNETECQRCASNCQLVAGTTSYCGDGRVDEDHEGCDNGSANGETKCAYGATECQVCTTQCQPVTGETSYCGDGERDEDHEACDNGELNGQTNCAYGEESCTLCSETCQNVAGAVSYCGDGRVDAENGETCDDGSNLNGTYGHCNATCDGEAAHCGDGTIDVANGETCDDGELNGTYDKCNATCNGRAAHCGDGNVDGENDEECDNGEANGETKCAYGETECTLCTTECRTAAGNTSFCGDETIDTANGEQCDSGEENGETSCIYGEESCTLCSETCQNVQGSVSYCGDGIVDGGNNETCDDGAILNGRYGHCNANCDGAASRCGDGILDSDSGEQCDDGELNGTYGKCNATCSGRSPFCGDGNIDTENGEVCDNGTSNGATDCAYGEESCSLCTTECQPEEGAVSYCGDSTIDTANGEQCDNGELNGQTNCAYGEESCTLCSETCQNVAGAVSYCGDGRVDAENNETCDDGANLNGTYGHCNATCSGEAAHCGDGNIDSANGETCDDGELNGSYGKCNAACNGRSPFCGDGNIDEGHETCDNGAENGRTACAYGEHECTLCSAECQSVQGTVSYCGDNNIDEANNEACDSGELNGRTKCAYGEESCTLCSATCQPLSGETSFCGDGRVDETNNETCDEGANLNGTYGHCNATCSGLAAHCGDGNVDTENNETCDEGEANGTYSHCNATCSGLAAHCGDGNIDEGHETCDNGAENGATDCAYGEHGCTLCSTQCQPVQGATSYCGDGTKDEAHEACDNGAENGATDCAYGATECKVCTAQCIEIPGAASYCGDGRVDTENNETCDEGANLNGTYGHCNSTCSSEAAHCGDGNIDEANGETCDDGELNGSYGKCNATCNGRAPYCGDGNIDEGHETCDNGADNGRTACAYGEENCTLCSTQCQPVQGTTSLCGDSNVDETNGEVCDRGELNGQTNCAYNETECTVCTAQCREIQGAVSFCGDSTVDAANEEECDKGFGNGIAECAYGQTSCTVCTAQCKNDTGVTSYCGDSTVDTANGEQCDSGEENGTTKCAYGETSCLVCSAQCREIAGATSYCGDGIVDAENNETCDEGANLNGTYGHCNATCSGEASHCGDGTVDTENGETCDDGELNGTYGKCNATCSGLAAHCGDGTVDTGNDEECDKGAANGETKCAYGATECQVCTAQCQLVTGETSYCGDNSVDEANNEACDRGELNGQTNCTYNETECTVCTAQCREIPGTTSYCGDGRVDAANNETCDLGFANGLSSCAYGEEECLVCTENCEEVGGETSYCGDRVVDAANGETCDNGEDNDATDCEYGQESCFVCTGECRKAAGATSYCGDGIVDAENEESCDEGVILNGLYGHCNEFCSGRASYCGDGDIDAANGEICDDGELNGTYGKCNTSCNGFASRCGDGILDTEKGEVCDRGLANGMTDCVYGELECILCSEECQEVSGFATYCGDGTVQADEVCDKAEPAVGEGEGIGAYCDDDCQEILGSCGDGILQYNEVCDNAETTVGEGEGIGAYCDDDCQTILGSCGDSILQVNELCDNGENNGNMDCAYGETECTVCTTECQPVQGVPSYCGDGKVDGRNGEVCDNAEPEVGDGHGIGSKCDETCSSITTKVLCTGQTRCSDGESYIDCPAEGEPLYGQDGQYAGKQSCQPHEFTKGETLEIEENIYYEQVYDAATGLRWLVTPSQATYENAKALCENPEGYGGYTWRLPTIKELNTIVHLDISYPAVREAFFSFNDSSYQFWSGTKASYGGAKALINMMQFTMTGTQEEPDPEYIEEFRENRYNILDFGQGAIRDVEKTNGDGDALYHVICVNGEEYGATGEYTVVNSNGDEIVSDSSTNLLWQKGFVNAKTIEKAFEYCENLNYAGYDDWRLPNRNEMMSLADYDSTGSSLTSFPDFATGIDDGMFSRYGYQMFWTSTFAPTYGGAEGFFIFEMVSGMIAASSQGDGINNAAVRCVRSKTEPYPEGKSIPYCNETGFTPCEDPETGIVWSQVLNTDNDTLSHEDVAELCRQSNDGGISQWRIPTVSELRTILGNSANLATGGACNVTDECGISSNEECYDYELCKNGSGFESRFYDYSYMISSTLTGEGENSSWMMNLRSGSLEPHSPQYIYYPTSSRCVLDESLPAVTGFFTDPDTGLSWSRLTGERNKAGAVKYCETLVQGGYDDWRIPTIDELRTLVINCQEEGGCDQSFDGIYSALNDSATLWSSTLTVVNDATALNFFDFSTATQISETESLDSVTAKLRCVRSDNDEPSTVVTEFPYHDEESGFWWSEKSGPFSSYAEAESYCADLAQSNYGGMSWELPMLEEYATVLDCTLPNFGDAGCSEISFSSSRSLFGDTETFISASLYYDRYPEVIDFSTGELGVIFAEQGMSGLIMSSNTSDLLPVSDLYVRCIGFDENACDGDNPCAGVEHSTGECTSIRGQAVCICDENYTWNGEECAGDTRSVLCDSALPDNGWWNGQSYSQNNEGRKYIYQTWNGEEWLPTTTTHYSVEPDESEGCTFKCLDSYVWNGEECATFPYIEPESGLTWSSYNQASVTYGSAVSYCEDLEEGGYDDWRLPTIDELRTLIRNCPGTQTGGACRVSDPNHLSYSDDWTDACSSCGSVGGRGYFSKLGGYDSSFWSSSVRSDSTDYNWVVNFTDASVGIYQNRNYAAPVARCVRGEYRGGYTDPDTGITWSSLKEDSDEDYLDWEQAFGYCENLEEGGYTDWRMPTIEELRTIVTNCPNVEPGGECGDYFYDGGFGDCNCDESMGSKLGDGDDVMLWSSTIAQEDAISIGYVAGVDFLNDNVNPFLINGRASVHCVRSDLPVDTQRYGTCYGLPEHAEWNSYDLILQTWNGSEWLPAIPAAVFSENAGETQDCSFRCYYDDLTWNGSECVCRNEGYFWNGMTCLPSPCEDTPGLCAGIEHGNGICKSGSSTEYSCGCDDGYAWNGSECEPLPECSTTSGTPCMDSESTLIWSAESAGKKIWYDAVAYCENLEEGGYTDWRMPDIDELRTLIQNCAYTEPGGACNVTTNCLYFYNEECFDRDLCYNNSCSYDTAGGHSKFGDASDLWSSSPIPDYGGAWFVDFKNGRIGYDFKDDSYNVRCVRTVQQGDTISFPYTDETNGLVWSAMSEEGLSWSGAAEYCGTLNEGGSDNWRVPTLAELGTLVTGCPEGNCGPLSVGGYSIFDEGETLWSSDYTMGNSAESAVFNVFDFGTASQTELSYTDATAAEIGVRCVRSTSDPLARPQVELPYLQEYEENGNTYNFYWSEKSQITTYAEAEAYCADLAQSNYGGISGWTVPDFDFIMLLLESGNSENLLMEPRGIFNDFGAFVSSYSRGNGTHLYMDFTSFGYIMAADDGSSMITMDEEPYEGNVYVRCVYLDDQQTPDDPCENNPCTGIEHSNEQCSAGEQGGYVCGCTGNHSWNGQACVETLQQLPECGEGTTPCLDSETALSWSSKSAEIEWEDALSYCENLEEGGYSDWRLPNIDELRTIIRNCTGVQTGGACPTSEPDYLSESDAGEACWCDESMSNIFSDEEEETGLWSSSVVSDDTDFIWFIDFYNKDLGYVLWNSVAEARCVRSDNPPAGQEPRQAECTGLPARAVWNNTGTITQTWHLMEREWLPSSEGSYNEEASSEECRFKCIDGYTWSGRSCVVITPYTDPETSLTWSAESDSNIAWENAASYCEDLEEGGYTDWRLPTVDELRTIIQNCEKTQPGGACAISDPDHLSSEDYVYDDCRCTEEYPEGYSKLGYGDQYGMLWSSSGNSYNNNYAWAVSFTDGTVFDSLKVNHLIVRCVRSAQQSQVDPCDPNPCTGIEHSDESCSVDQQGGYTCGCVDGYEWDGEACQRLTLGNICTGQTLCYNDDGDEITCPTSESADFFGQDAQYTSKCTAQSFTAGTAAQSGTVIDNNTGLIWEQSPSENTYTWDDAQNHCNDLNSSNYGGKSNWRVPNPLEFMTIVDISTYNPATNSNFTGMSTSNSTYLWTNNEYKGDTSYAYYFSPSYGRNWYDGTKTNTYKVLCVSGEEMKPAVSSDFTTSSDGKTVTDNRTGLIWQKEYATGRTWQEALKYCEDLSYAGYSDWRLPNKNELASLLDPGKSSAPYSNFPDMPSDYFWSSSTSVTGTSNAWLVDFDSGGVSSYSKTYSRYVRCVR